MKAHVFNAGTYLPETRAELARSPEWQPFAEWFEEYMGYAPEAENEDHVEYFEAFYSGRIYQIESKAEFTGFAKVS